MLMAPFTVIELPATIVSVLNGFDAGVVRIAAGESVYSVPASSKGISNVIPAGIS